MITVSESHGHTWGNRPSLAETHPKLVAEWDSSKNGATFPFTFTLGSNKVVWWCCAQGHAWRARVADRTRGTGCPTCAIKVERGRSDFQSVAPSAAAEWHPILNRKVIPWDVAAQSQRKHWFECERKHEYEVTLASRSSGSGCGFCSGRNLLAGSNGLATKFPLLASEWHPKLNEELSASMVMAHSNRIIHWECKKGHHWKAAAYSRPRGSGCPTCSDKVALEGFNTLNDVYPEVAKQWLTSDKALSPTEVTVSSGVKVTWRCEEHHTWIARVAQRSAGQKCPYCVSRRTPPAGAGG